MGNRVRVYFPVPDTYVTNQPPKANSAFHPSGVGKWVPPSAGKAKAGIYTVHSVSGWTRGVQVKLWDPLRTHAIPERLRGVISTRRYMNPRLPLPLPLPRTYPFGKSKINHSHDLSIVIDDSRLRKKPFNITSLHIAVHGISADGLHVYVIDETAPLCCKHRI